MKSSYLGAAAALACAVGLSACGGSDGEYLLSGSVTGANKDGLVLQNNGGHDLTVPAGATRFAFPDLLEVDSAYHVTVKSTPPNAEKCEVFNAQGRATWDVGSVAVVCYLKTHALGGPVTGLGNASGLVVVNGADRVAIPAGATSFAMAKVGEDVPYGITILSQPAGLTCSVARGVGTMRTADINDVQISCVPSA